MIPFFLGAAGGAPAVGTVFASTLWTGNGSNRTITSGIDADLVWIKQRSGLSTSHRLFDTLRGATNSLLSNATNAETVDANSLTAFSATGFNLGNSTNVNASAETYVAWSFARAARFFDVVTWTGDGGTSSRIINHALGARPGLVLIKRRDGIGEWHALARQTDTNLAWLYVGSTAAAGSVGGEPTFSTLGITSTGIDVAKIFLNSPSYPGAGMGNNSGETYVAYLFAHDAAGDGIVQCGSYAGNASASGPTVTLGWQPQFLLVKRAIGGTGNWVIFDTARGIPAGSDPTLCPNSGAAEDGVLSAADYLDLTGTGFQLASSDTNVNGASSTYVYLAIRSA